MVSLNELQDGWWLKKIITSLIPRIIILGLNVCFMCIDPEYSVQFI